MPIQCVYPGLFPAPDNVINLILPAENAQYLLSGDGDEWLVATAVRDSREAPIDPKRLFPQHDSKTALHIRIRFHLKFRKI
jgi:hypothetical protein